jgi:hypothetical protein
VDATPFVDAGPALADDACEAPADEGPDSPVEADATPMPVKMAAPIPKATANPAVLKYRGRSMTPLGWLIFVSNTVAGKLAAYVP